VWSLAVAFVLYLFGFQTGYAIVNPSIKRDLGLTVSQIGLIAATYTWSFAIFQLFSGALLDRLGARAVLGPAIALVTAGVFACAHAANFPSIIGSQLILALGACAGFVGAGYIGGQWFGMARFSFMFGLVQCFASLFSAFNQNLMTLALRHLEWRTLFDWVGVFGVILFVLGVAFIRNPVPVKGTAGRQGLGAIVGDLLSDIVQVAKIGHVWLAAIYGALVFGALLAAGVIWAPKLMLVRGLSQGAANLAASLLWLGLAVGCVIFPWWSDAVRRRKLPVLIGIVLQLIALLALVYLPQLNATVAMALWFIFGFGAAAHMLAFSAAADVVSLKQIGTSAAIVNGTMFLVSGLLIARPGQIVNRLTAASMPVSAELAQRALRPLELSLIGALVLAALIRESFPNEK
jgi:MFS family permease